MFQTPDEGVQHQDAVQKVTGRAVYVDDMKPGNCLYGKTVRTSVPRCLIEDIRFLDGVPWHEFTIVLPRDIPGKNAVTLIDATQPFLAVRESRHVAEPVALIAHPDRQLAEKALNHVRVGIRELPAILTMEESLRAHNLQYGTDNIFKSYLIQDGDPDTEWPKADLVLEDTYRTGAQEHLYIEPQGMVAQAEPGKGVTVWGSMQCPYYVRKALAPLFGLPPDQVRVIQTDTGGGFGGKEEYPNLLAGHAALLSWKAGGKPVKMVYDRGEDMLATPKRHPSQTRIRAAFRKDGTLLALDVDLLLDGGAYPTLSPVVLSRAILHSWGPYRCPHARLRARCVMTNSVPYGAMRGFGAPQATFALEMHMSRAAHELGMDPAELRRANFLRQGDRMPTGQIIRQELDLGMMLDRALELADYHRKRREFEVANRRPGQKRKGMGLSCFYHGAGFTGGGEVALASRLAMRLTEAGGVEVLSASVDYGQGTRAVFAQIASETCNIPPAWVEVHRPDTGEVPDSGPTVASRTTMIVGKLVERAGRQMRERLTAAGYLPRDYQPQDFRDAARRYLREQGGLEVEVRYDPPGGIHWDEDRFRGDAYSGYSWACDVAEVEMDNVDYSAQVKHFVSVVECGRVINPAFALGQIEGGIAQAIGFALHENVVLQQGAMVNSRHANYTIPTTGDVPEIKVEFMEFPDANPGRRQAKGIGELPMDGPAPAIASALAQALGGRFINQIPLLPERIMQEVG